MAKQYYLRTTYIHPKSSNIYYQSTEPYDKEHLPYELVELLERDPSKFLIIDKLDSNIKVTQELIESSPIPTKRINKSDNQVLPIKTSVKTNINTATLEQLKEVQGVGNSTAYKVIENRPFKSIDELNEKVPLHGGKNWKNYDIFIDESNTESNDSE